MLLVDEGLVRRATGAAVLRGGASGYTAVSIDGRGLLQGALYFAIRGERHDGHDFVAQAEQAGAAGVVVTRGQGQAALAATRHVTVLEVDEPTLALGRLARAHRLSCRSTKFVALTGSVGKTSTKEMLAAIFVAAVGEAAVHKTRGNLNNHLGVPLTLLGVTPAHRYAVVELGMSALNKIAYLEGLTRPDVALCTNVAGVHLEQLGGLENVGRAKGEIFEGRAAAGQAYAVAPLGEGLLGPALAQVPMARRRSFGGEGADVCVLEAAVEGQGTRISLGLPTQTLSIRLPLLGVHHARNAAAAVAAALALGIEVGAIEAGLAAVRPEKHRMQLVQIGGRTVIDDCYNASPPSVIAGIDALVALAGPGARRIAVLGDMLELGASGPEAHLAIGRYVGERVSGLVAIGPLSKETMRAAQERLGASEVFHTDDPVAAAARALASSGPGDALLVKGSRGMKLERVLEAMARLAEASA